MSRHQKRDNTPDRHIRYDEEHTPEEWKEIDDRNIRKIYVLDDEYWKGTWITKEQYNMLLEELAHSQKEAS